MSTLLYIKASPRGPRSKSVQAADAFLQAYAAVHPDDEVITLDVFKRDLPAFDGLAVQAKYTIMHGQEHSQAELDAWAAVEALIEEFKAADKYVFAAPMWNFGIPYRLKQYIDLLVQPTYTFAATSDGDYEGLVTGKPAVVFFARGGEYTTPDMAGWDHQKPYLELVLGFIGFTDVQGITIEPTLHGGPDVAHQKVAEAIEQGKRLAADF